MYKQSTSGYLLFCVSSDLFPIIGVCSSYPNFGSANCCFFFFLSFDSFCVLSARVHNEFLKLQSNKHIHMICNHDNLNISMNNSLEFCYTFQCWLFMYWYICISARKFTLNSDVPYQFMTIFLVWMIVAFWMHCFYWCSYLFRSFVNTMVSTHNSIMSKVNCSARWREQNE